MNKNDLVKNGVERVFELLSEERFTDIESLYDENEVHDILCGVFIDGVKIENDDSLYDEMLELLDEDLCNQIHDEVESGVDYENVMNEQWSVYYSQIM